MTAGHAKHVGQTDEWDHRGDDPQGSLSLRFFLGLSPGFHGLISGLRPEARNSLVATDDAGLAASLAVRSVSRMMFIRVTSTTMSSTTPIANPANACGQKAASGIAMYTKPALISCRRLFLQDAVRQRFGVHSVAIGVGMPKSFCRH